ncbi:uncharacterized protein LOC135846355 isoform X2 [Planococcus citri]|uniref:uncharacterized protein LOC135846355 isoform X2 n=1 Tax=Planococcus citri TaxID=170843 RepID=UPI0031F86B7A
MNKRDDVDLVSLRSYLSAVLPIFFDQTDIDILDRLRAVPFPLNPMNYFKFVVFAWLRNEKLTVTCGDIELNDQNVMVDKKWMHSENFIVIFTSENPNIPSREMELNFRNTIFQEFVVEVRVPGGRFEVVSSQSDIPHFDPDSSENLRIISVITNNLKVIHDDVIEVYRSGREVYPLSNRESSGSN